MKIGHTLIQAKNSDSKGALRQAVGQLYDDRHLHHLSVYLAVPLPYPPKAERLDLLRSAGVEASGPGAETSRLAHGAFV